ncbi:unnamed protein product [Caenorhabditis brenneri]
MSVKELFDHFQFIFHISIIDIMYFGPDCERFSLESIHRNIIDFKRICFPSENHEQHGRVLRFFQPASLALLEDALVNGHVPRDILAQNFDVIVFESAQIALDDLLVNNARSIHLTCNGLTIKTLNRFLKLWIKGSNPRLEYLNLEFRSNDFQKEEILRRLKHQCAPLNRRRFCKVSGKKKPLKVIGGWDIWRFDGTQATISTGLRGTLVSFELFVWHDHCIVN